MRHEPIAERTRGRWPSILRAIGLPEKALRNKHGPCPMCGGKDRFRFDDIGGNGTFICSQCGAGKGTQLVMLFLGLPFKEAVRKIEEHIGDAPVMPSSQGQRKSEDTIRETMTAMWKRAKPIAYDDLAGEYLFGRTGLTLYPPTLRFCADERYTEDGQKPQWFPAMIARVDPSDAARAAGEHAAIHRTYLSIGGGKAEVSSPRKMMGSMPTGAAVRLAEHGEVLGIAEGIETALSASALFGVPVWSALTADLLQAWEPPANVSTVWIFGDNDQSFTGQAAAYGLARRLKARKLNVTVELPQRTGVDWNDIWQERKQS